MDGDSLCNCLTLYRTNHVEFTYNLLRQARHLTSFCTRTEAAKNLIC